MPKRLRSTDPNLRWCNKCADFQPTSAFGVDNAMSDGLATLCRTHKKSLVRPHPNTNRIQNLKQRYGITPDDYAAMFTAQGGACAICKRHPENKLAVDHCHTSGKVRGLLCMNCNQALGKFRDDTKIMEAAIAYLQS